MDRNRVGDPHSYYVKHSGRMNAHHNPFIGKSIKSWNFNNGSDDYIEKETVWKVTTNFKNTCTNDTCRWYVQAREDMQAFWTRLSLRRKKKLKEKEVLQARYCIIWLFFIWFSRQRFFLRNMRKKVKTVVGNQYRILA